MAVGRPVDCKDIYLFYLSLLPAQLGCSGGPIYLPVRGGKWSFRGAIIRSCAKSCSLKLRLPISPGDEESRDWVMYGAAGGTFVWLLIILVKEGRNGCLSDKVTLLRCNIILSIVHFLVMFCFFVLLTFLHNRDVTREEMGENFQMHQSVLNVTRGNGLFFRCREMRREKR